MSGAVATAKAPGVPGGGAAAMAVDQPARAAEAGPAGEEGDLYTRLKTLQRQLEFLEIQARAGGGGGGGW